MFNTSPYPTARSNQFQAYRQVGAATAIDGATPHKLVAMLMDAVIDELARARGALSRGDIADKGRAIGRAVRLLDEGLKGPLDLQAGGALAQRLSDLYDYLLRRLTQANLHNDDDALQECARLMGTVREGWSGIAAGADAPQMAAA
jgi:flagellar protein FliS